MGEIHEDITLHDRAPVFRNREEAGDLLAGYLLDFPGFRDPLSCPIPAGGVPVGIAVARALGCPIRPVIVRKVQVPWNTEAGFGAVAWDGRVFLNEPLLATLRLSPDQVETAVEKARKNVQERVAHFSAGQAFADPEGRSCILIDDGLASGYTMTAAAEALRAFHPRQIVVAVPTGSLSAARKVSAVVDDVICLNIRTGPSFAVADAYEEWYDIAENDAIRMLRDATG
jgi:predicted phosphoribosyltransferase